jgi:glutaminyl-peptide cyclotransferase
MKRLLFACALLLGSPAFAELPVTPARVVRALPHDPTAFTEGLFIDGGQLWESTGEVGRSSIRHVDLATGRVLASVSVPPPLFGEGVAPWKGTIISLTWRDGMGFRWQRGAKGLRLIGRFAYIGEGWALTGDGHELIMSDGTDTLRIIEPDQFRVTRLLRVTAEGQPVEMLNELEYVDGEILANVWMTDRIARIDPATGHVLGWIDLAALHQKAGVFGPDQVANGIAYDAARHRLYVTGKEWPVLFEIALPKRH